MAQELTWVVESRYSLNSSFDDEFFERPSQINLSLFLLLLSSIELNSTNSIECVRFKPVTHVKGTVPVTSCVPPAVMKMTPKRSRAFSNFLSYL